jgi:hypothetical protein
MGQTLGRVVVAGALCGMCGCGSPFLHPAATSGVADAGLVGEWVSSDPEIRAVIAPSDGEHAAGKYGVGLTVYDDGEHRADLSLELTLFEADGTRYADLFLSRTERDELVNAYGFLVVPVHQIMKVVRERDSLTVWSFRGDWLEETVSSGSFAYERVAIGGSDIVMVTAPTERIKALLARHSEDDRLFGAPIVFRRSASAPPSVSHFWRDTGSKLSSANTE